MIIHVGHINHRHGLNHYAATTREGLMDQIAAYCRVWWEYDGPEETMPEADQDLVDRYFEWCSEIGSNESLYTDEVELVGS